MSETQGPHASRRPQRGPLTSREEALLRLASDEPLERMLPAFLARLREIVPFDWAALAAPPLPGAGPDVLAWRWQAEEAAFELAEEVPPGLLTDRGSAAGSAGGKSVAVAFRAGATVVPDATKVPDPTVVPGVRHLARFPLDCGAPACVWIGRSSGRAFRPAELLRAEPVWAALAQALCRDLRTRAMEQTSRDRSSELSTVFEVVRAAGRALDFDALFESLASTVQPLVQLDALAVLTELEGHRGLVINLARPMTPQLLEELSTRCRNAFRGECGREAGRAARISPLPGFDPEEPSVGLPLRLFEAFPLKRRGECVGVVGFASHRLRPSQTLARILATAAGQASLTVDRLQSGEEAQARQLRAVMDSLTDGVALADADGRVAIANSAAGDHLRLISGDASRRLEDLGGVRFAQLAGQALSTRGPAVAEITLPAARKIFRLSVHPLAGRPEGAGDFVVVTSDITEARALQEQMLQTEKLSSLGELISGVAHELNNPLAAVMGYAQLLQGAEIEGDTRRRLEIIASEAGRCQTIVRNLLSFARRHRPERRALSVNEAVRSVLGLLAYQLRVDSIETITELDPALPAIQGDPHQLQQALLNLVSNAHHALRQSSPPRRLTIRTRGSDDLVRIEVEDTGPGIPAEILPVIFDPFFTTKEVGQGTGLGLSIVFGIVESHGGRTTAGAGASGGALFTIDLPSGAGADAAAPDRTGGEGRSADDPLPLPARSILVVEDEEAIASLLREALGADGHRVDTAEDGGAARDRIREREYDLIITDLKMPRADGRELYEETVRGRPELAGRFIFATGDVVSPEAQEFFRATGRPFLEKPFDVADLRRLIRSVLEDGMP